MIWHANVEGNLVCVDFNIRVLKYSSTLYIIDRRSVSDLDRGTGFIVLFLLLSHDMRQKYGFYIKVMFKKCNGNA